MGEQICRTLGRDAQRLKTELERQWKKYSKFTSRLRRSAVAGDHDPEMRRKYSFGLMVSSELDPGSRYVAWATVPILEGETWRSTRRPPGANFRALWMRTQGRGTSRVTWQIDPSATHACSSDARQLREAPRSDLGGWPMILRIEDAARNRRAADDAGSLQYQRA